MIRIVEESYLRNDLGLGARQGKTLQASDMHALLKSKQAAAASASSTKLSSSATAGSSGSSDNALECSWLVPDTNVVLHQMDLLEVKTIIWQPD